MAALKKRRSKFNGMMRVSPMKPGLRGSQNWMAAQMRAAKALMAWDIKLMHFIMVSLHFGSLIVVSLFFKRLFVDRRGNLHNCKDEWSDGDDESVLVTDRGSVRTGYTKASFGSRQTKTSHARSYGNKIINRIELSNRDMEQLLLKRSGTTNPFTDILQAYETELIDTIYLNDKEQLIRIQPVEKNGRMVDIHNILTFDAN